MTMLWFIPLAISIGLLGTRTAIHERHLEGGTHRLKGWWLLFLLSWAPTLCWMMAQVVRQD